MNFLKFNIVFLSIFLGSCESSFTTENIWRNDVKSVSIEVFKNNTLIPGIERDLAIALEHEILSRTNYTITSRNLADTILSGTIQKQSTRGISRSRETTLLNEALATTTISFEWRNQNTGELISGSRSISASGLFTPSRSRNYASNEFHTTGSSPGEPGDIGQFEATSDLARKIVDQMDAPW